MGAGVLAAGGNAVDAAVAAAFVQGVVDPLMCGIGGMAVIQVADADGRAHIIDGLGASPAGVSEDMWADRYLGLTMDGFGYRVEGFVNEAGAQAVLTPGALRAYGQLHARFGSLPWADLLTPAIRCASEGWLVRPHNTMIFTQNERKYGRTNIGEKLAVTPDGRRIYLGPDGAYPGVGDTIVNTDLADTLMHIGRRGADDLYTGELASAAGDAVAADGGFLRPSDLAAYTARDFDPLTHDYRGLRVSVPPAPAGGVQMLETLGLLTRFDLAGIAHSSPEHIRILTAAMKHALLDKERLWAAPDTDDEAYAHLLSVESLDTAAESIRPGERLDLEALRPPAEARDSRDTTHLGVMDAEGLTVVTTHSLGNPSGYIPPGTGFMLNGGMSTFDPRPGRSNSVGPGRRRTTTMCPTIVFDGADPVIAIGAPGGAWITPAVAQGISNIIDFRMSALQAVMAPRIVATSNAIDISNRIPRRVQAVVEDMGYTVHRSPLSYAFGALHAITRFDGELTGGADPQRDGYAAGV